MFSNTEDSFWALLVKCFPVKKMRVITWERCYMLKEQENHHTFNKEADATVSSRELFYFSLRLQPDDSMMASMNSYSLSCQLKK